MKSLRKKIREITKDMKIRQRMVCVFMIGSFLPMALVYVIMFNQQNQTYIDSQIESDIKELNSNSDKVTAAMELAMEFSEHIYCDSNSKKIVLKRYGTDSPLTVDNKTFGQLWDYVNSYYQDIHSICIYVNDGAVEKVDNHNFKLLTDTIKNKSWYKETVKLHGAPHWSYITSVQTSDRSLRLTRVLYDQNQEAYGVLSIGLEASLSEQFISEQNAYAIMSLNDSELVHWNFNITLNEFEYLINRTEKLNSPNVTEYYGDLRFRGDDCTISSIRILPRHSSDYYTIYLIHSNKSITKATRGRVVLGLLPLVFGGAIMLFSLLWLSKWFSKRIAALNRAMFYAVTNQDIVRAERQMGVARDEIWELYSSLEKMVRDMKEKDQEILDEKIQREQLYSRQRDIEFKMLTAQINPHFLYNTLETIRMLAIINKQNDIEDISVKLTKLLRSSLEAGAELRTLSWEMENIECYISIQSYRFDERIKAVVEYDKEEAKNYYILPFLIQPFVENAYVHAMEDMSEGGLIRINVEINNDILLMIEDNGHGMTKEELYDINQNLNNFEKIDRTHIGVANVNQRIKLRFGDRYGVRLNSAEGSGTTVYIRLPKISTP